MFVHIQLSSRHISFLPGNFLPPLCVFHFSTIQYDKTTAIEKEKKKTKNRTTIWPSRPTGFSLGLSPESASESYLVVSDSLRPHGLYSLWNSPSQNTGVGSCSLLQGIFPTQVSRIAGRFFTSWAPMSSINFLLCCRTSGAGLDGFVPKLLMDTYRRPTSLSLNFVDGEAFVLQNLKSCG